MVDDRTVTVSDAALLRESRRRPDAFVEVCARHGDDLASWLRREVGPAAAEDLLAETLARAWYARRRFRDPGTGSAGAWLQGIARNLVRDYRRRGAIETQARRRLRLPLEVAPIDEAEERVSAQLTYGGIGALVDALPDGQRDALRLRVVDELEYEEIGRRLAIDTTTARTRVHRALKALRSQIGRSER